MALFWDKHRKIIEQVLQKKLILDIGGGTPWSTGWIHKHYGHILKDKAWCIDIDSSKKPHVVGNITHLPFPDERVDGIICNAVLEHIPKPQEAVQEIHRILKKGGRFFFYLPWLYPYHGGPHDYFRFSPHAIENIFSDFREMKWIARGQGSLRVGLGLLTGYKEPFNTILNVVVAYPAEIAIKIIICIFKIFGINSSAKLLEMYLSPYIAHGYFVYGRK